MTRLFPWRREPREANHPGRHRIYTMADVDRLAGRTGPLPLPTMRRVDAARPAADVLASANRRPTAQGTHTHRPPRTVEHVGATEDFGDELAGMREDLAHDTGSLDPDDIAWTAAFAAAEEAIEREAAAGRYRLHKAIDRFAPGWRGEPRVPVDDFAAAMALATGEIPVCTEVDA